MTTFERRTFLKGMGGVAAGAVLLGACNSSSNNATAAGGRPTIRLKSWGDLGFPAPFTYVAGPGYWRMSLLFDSLTWPDSTGNQVPWLASSYKRSDDGLVWSLDLRDAKWSDGRPVLASDVVFTYHYYTSRTFTPLLTGVPRGGVDVRATGDRSVEFHLPAPDATFLQQTLGTMPIVPEHVFSNISDPMGDFSKDTFIGCGAYTLRSKDTNADSESYVARDDYYLGVPYVKRIEAIYLPSDDDLAGIRAGVIDAGASQAEGVRNEVLAPFRNNPKYGLIKSPAGFGFPLFFNMTRGGALADYRFRSGCVRAINREDLIKRLLTGNGELGSAGWLPSTNPFYTADGVMEYPFDPTEAERLMDEAGFPRGANGERVHFKLTMPNTVPTALAELFVANLGAVGVKVDLESLDLPPVYGKKLAATYDLLIQSYPGPAGIGPNNDPDQLRGVFSSHPPSGTHQATGYNNPEVDRLLDAQFQTYDMEERKRLVTQIQQIVSKDLPVMMLYYTDFFFAYKKNVFDQWYYTPGGFSTGLSDAYNKQPYITGNKVGTEMRTATSTTRAK